MIHPNRTAFLDGARFSPDGKRLVAGDYPGGVVVVWDVTSGKQLTTLETGYGYRGSYEYFFLTPDWQTLFVPREKRKAERVEQGGKVQYRLTFDGSVRAWDLATGRLRRTYQHQPPRGISEMRLSPDGTRFVTFEELPGTYEGSPRWGASLWDVATGQCHPLPDGLESRGQFSPDGRTLAITSMDAAGHAQAVKLFDTASGREKGSIPIQDKDAWASVSAFSPDNRLLAVYQAAPRCWLRWCDVATGREVFSYGGAKNEGFRCCFSPDGQTLAAVHRLDEKIDLLLFRVRGRRLDRAVPLGTNQKGERLITSSPVLSPDGKWLAVTTQVIPERSGGGDVDAQELAQPRIHMIDVAAAAERETLVAPQGLTHAACCFSPDGRTLATGGYGRILLWDLSRPPLAAATGDARSAGGAP